MNKTGFRPWLPDGRYAQWPPMADTLKLRRVQVLR